MLFSCSALFFVFGCLNFIKTPTDINYTQFLFISAIVFALWHISDKLANAIEEIKKLNSDRE